MITVILAGNTHNMVDSSPNHRFTNITFLASISRRMAYHTNSHHLADAYNPPKFQHPRKSQRLLHG